MRETEDCLAWSGLFCVREARLMALSNEKKRVKKGAQREEENHIKEGKSRNAWVVYVLLKLYEIKR